MRWLVGRSVFGVCVHRVFLLWNDDDDDDRVWRIVDVVVVVDYRRQGRPSAARVWVGEVGVVDGVCFSYTMCIFAMHFAKE